VSSSALDSCKPFTQTAVCWSNPDVLYSATIASVFRLTQLHNLGEIDVTCKAPVWDPWRTC
jgi:hypothetical protein